MKSKRRFLIIVAVLVGLAVASVGIAYAITNGEPDGGAHPYVGLLVFEDWDPPPGEPSAWACSGSLIAPGVVLTAGHCTYGAEEARVWFNERLQDEDGTWLVPDFPWGGAVAVEGTALTNPDFCHMCYGPSRGLPAFSYRDVGVVVLVEPVSCLDVGRWIR